MRLLILTQKVDQNDDVLGFFHVWLLEFAKQIEEIHVICLYEGTHNLPTNVHVHSLGKENRESRLQYILKFYKYIFSLKNSYDTVFIHMNPEYLALGSIVWKILGKRIFLWFNHAKGNLFVKLFKNFADKIFCTSEFAFVKKYEKTELMPAGIDTTIFIDQAEKREPNSFLLFGRISPIKKIHTLLPALKTLKDRKAPFTVTIMGDAPPQDKTYEEKLQKDLEPYIQKGIVSLKSGVPNKEAVGVFNAYEFYINLTPSGSFDKTILEAMACGTIPLVANRSFEGVLEANRLLEEDSAEDLAKKINAALQNDKAVLDKEKATYRAYVASHHSISVLAEKIAKL